MNSNTAFGFFSGLSHNVMPLPMPTTLPVPIAMASSVLQVWRPAHSQRSVPATLIALFQLNVVVVLAPVLVLVRMILV